MVATKKKAKKAVVKSHRCAAKTKAGKACKRSVKGNAKFCAAHSKKR